MNLLASKRFRRAKDKDFVFDILDIKKNKKTGFFSKMTEIYIFALALGVKENRREIIVSASEPIACDIFTEEQQKYFDTVVLFNEKGDVSKLNKENEENVQQYMKTIEEYTNCGLEIIKEQLSIHPEDSFNIISRLVNDKINDIIPTAAEEDFEW